MHAHEFKLFDHDHARAWLEFHFRRRTAKHIIKGDGKFVLDENGEPVVDEKEEPNQYNVLVVEYNPRELEPTKSKEPGKQSLFAYCQELLMELDDEIDEIVLRASPLS
jgi:hypothetical protein